MDLLSNASIEPTCNATKLLEPRAADRMGSTSLGLLRVRSHSAGSHYINMPDTNQGLYQGSGKNHALPSVLPRYSAAELIDNEAVRIGTHELEHFQKCALGAQRPPGCLNGSPPMIKALWDCGSTPFHDSRTIPKSPSGTVRSRN